MVDRGDERYMGPAYSYEADYLLLNVSAGRMGAFSEDPEFALHESAHREPVGGTTCDHVRAKVLTSP